MIIVGKTSLDLNISFQKEKKKKCVNLASTLNQTKRGNMNYCRIKVEVNWHLNPISFSGRLMGTNQA